MAEVITTATGLQYEIMESGTGATPGATDVVSAHYHGTFLDGRVFDSSVQRGEPIDLPVNGVIAGWTEALMMMKEGDKWRLTVPPELGYGARGVGPIPGNTTLIFEVELIAVR
jgi:FKBP-type peptidyl-prolyl cis-trans isomerase FklB